MQHQKLEPLIDLAETLSQQNDYDEILRLVAQQAASLLRAEVALIMMINPQTRQTVKTIMREGRKDDDRKYRLVQNQVSGWLVKTGEPLLTAEIKNDARFAKVKFGDVAIKSVIAVLLKIEGVTIGSLILLNKSGGESFTEPALDYLNKIAIIAAPYLRNVQKLQQYFEPALPDDSLLAKYAEAGLLGRSKEFVRLLHTIEAATRCDVRVLLEGQSGTGKELIARAIHRFSARSSQPFVAIDCGAIQPHLIESELFGHLKGAFTGAVADRKGLLDSANNGTLFMDEIANLPLDVQAKLMRFLQEGEIRPVGSNKSHKVDVRIISASSSTLQKLVTIEKFREDLFYRLHVYPVYVPPLNKRREDIPILASWFLEKYSNQQQKALEYFDDTIVEFLLCRQWNGNIRELENLIERLVTLASPEAVSLTEEVLPDDIKKEQARFETHDSHPHASASLSESVARFEEKIICQAMAANDWNQSRTARALRVPVQTLRYKLDKYDIKKPD